MTAKVVTIASGKGGVGKTTSVANIAVALASRGQKVTCIDGDIGLRNLDVVLGLENRIVYDLVDVIEGRCRLRQAMIRDKRLPELYLIPAAQTRDKTAISPSDMVRLCDELRQEVDWIIIDSPAGIERGFKNAIAAADQVLGDDQPRSFGSARCRPGNRPPRSRGEGSCRLGHQPVGSCHGETR